MTDSEIQFLDDLRHVERHIFKLLKQSLRIDTHSPVVVRRLNRIMALLADVERASSWR